MDNTFIQSMTKAKNGTHFRDPSWLALRRSQAFDRFAAMGWPSKSDEVWKYLSFTALASQEFVPACHVPPLPWTKEQVISASALKGAGPLLVFLNGAFSAHLSQRKNLPEGVQILSLPEVENCGDGWTQPLLGRLTCELHHPFAALNEALMEDGLFFFIPPGARLEEPVEVLFISYSNGSATMTHPRILISASEDSQCTIVTHYQGMAETHPYLTNAVTEIFLGPQAKVDLYRIQQEHGNAFHFDTGIVRHEDGSRLTANDLSLGGQLNRCDFYSRIQAPHAVSHFNGLYLADAGQQMDHHLVVDHLKPQGESRIFFKGILDGASKGVFDGKVVVHPQAQKTNSEQINRNLLLSREAEVAPKPQLEIYADDVQCSHGATVGTLDANALFYMRSRGIDEKAARMMLTHAFGSEVFEHMASALMRHYCEYVFSRRLKDERA